MTTTTQMNIRINSALKSAGDAALLDIGLTPTDAIRALWEKASKRGKDLQQVKQLIITPSKPSIQTQPDSLLQEGSHIVEKGMQELGIDIQKCSDGPSYKALREEAALAYLSGETR